jgi:biopolymer transport protein ExbD
VRFKKKDTEELKPNLTPMIDIIFQLLIFFVLTAKFISFEGQLQAYLPKDRGLQPTTPVLANNVTLFLTWKDTQEVGCVTPQYEMHGTTRQNHVFQDDPKRQKIAGGYVTETTIGIGARQGKVTYDYAPPDFREIEEYLKYRRDGYEDTGGGSKGLPVEISFDKKVPWEMVVNLIDICKRLRISDISISAGEIEY